MSRTAPAIFRLTFIGLLIWAGARVLSRGVEGQARRGVPTVTKASRKEPPGLSSASLQSLRNIGKAYYEQGKYEEAIRAFQRVVASGRALATDHLDLGLALMQANKLDESLGELTTAKQMDPKLVAGVYNLGVLYKRELRYPQAEASFRRVIEADPQDPGAWFNLGTVYFAEKKLPEALDAHEHVVKMGFARGQNFYVAALFHTFTILVRLKRQDEAQKVLRIHETMRDKVPGLSLQSPALEAGRYGTILVPTVPASFVAPKSPPKKFLFADITAKLGVNLPSTIPAASPKEASLKEIQSSAYSLDFVRQRLLPAFSPSIAVGDYDEDGNVDLDVIVPSGHNLLFHNNVDGTFTDVTEKAGVAGPEGALSATFADYDNSGHPSLFVAGLGGVTLFHNNGDGTFTDETEKAGLKGTPGELATRAFLFDADNDGFLDLIVTVYTDLSAPPDKPSFTFPDDFPGASSHFYRNNGDGTFSDMTKQSGLASARGRMRGAVFADFDNNGYADLLFLRDDGPPLLYLNEGEGKFADHTSQAGKALARSRAVAAQVADFDHDGNFDLALWSPSGLEVLLNRGGARFRPADRLPSLAPPAGLFAFRGAVADVDGDAFDDLLAVDAAGRLRFLANHAGRFQEAALTMPSAPKVTPGEIVAASLADPGKLDLLEVTRDGQFKAYEKEGPPARWLEVKLDGSKSNKQGVGTIVELKAGNFYKKVEAAGGPVRVFTGDLTKLDVVRVTWPNAIVQNTIDAATNHAITVRESERLASSCPFLYVWNGKEYSFFTEILGVAPLGELLPDGSRVKPNPEDFVRLGALRDRDGVYSFQITNEMREVDYLDRVRLVAVDHPASHQIFANETYSSTPQPPSLYALAEQSTPLAAVDDAGQDVLPLIREVDGRYPAGFRRNPILGLADLHALTLDLGDFTQDARPALYLTGWVFWTDSNASRALRSNSKLHMVPPFLQVRDSHGKWMTVIADMGLPSGVNRTMRVDLAGKFLTRDHHVRIITNLCVYWDRIFFSTHEIPAPSPSELPLVSADLHYRGFSSFRTDSEHRKPDTFDYVHHLDDAPWNPMTGNYTRYGPVEKLLARADDRLVVMATGDELTVKFSSRNLPPLKPGWKRDFFLDVSGFAKDGEPNTLFSKTVDPLPFREMSDYLRASAEAERRRDRKFLEYLREYETRPAYLLISPLAPVVP